MSEWPHLVQSDLIGTPHGFLTGAQSDRGELDRVGGDMPTVFLDQVHSARVIVAEAPFAKGARPKADGMVTDRCGLRLAIVTADCAPILFADERAGVIGAAHAGWRGALGGVIENTVEAMVALGAKRKDIVAAIGPSIAQENYEVDDAFRDGFDAQDARFFEPGRSGHWQFDLWAYCGWRLALAGIVESECLCIDTYAAEDDFHSYRRATHRGEETAGRQISLIALHESA